MATAIRADLGMTLLTELRTLLCQQEGMIRPMGAVAQAAIFGDGIMLPEVRAAFLRMTFVAVVIEAHLFQHEGAIGTMRVVAIAADYLAFTNRMGRHLIGLSTNILVALVTDLGLGAAIHNLAGFVHAVAAAAGDFFHFMQAVVPLDQGPPLVTLHAHGVLRLNR